MGFFKEGDYLVIVDGGQGMHPDDIGKIVKYLPEAPMINKGGVSVKFEGYLGYDTYIEYVYTSRQKRFITTSKLSGHNYDKARNNQFRVAKQSDLEKVGLDAVSIWKAEHNIEMIEREIKDEIGI